MTEGGNTQISMDGGAGWIRLLTAVPHSSTGVKLHGVYRGGGAAWKRGEDSGYKTSCGSIQTVGSGGRVGHGMRSKRGQSWASVQAGRSHNKRCRAGGGQSPGSRQKIWVVGLIKSVSSNM